MTKDRKRLLEEVAAKERMMADVIAGKPVACPVCALPLAYFDTDSGRHPGIYCPTGCTQILMNVRKA